MRSKAVEALSENLTQKVVRLGQDLRMARTRRGLSLEDLAERAHTSVITIRKLEQGQPTTSLAVLLQVLNVFGLENQIDRLADPKEDVVGLAEERRRQPKRVHSPKKLEDLFD